jgi:DNA-binding IclR family transcriptional regulator
MPGDQPSTEEPLGRGGRIQSVDRAVALLRAVATATDGDATLQALAERTGLNRSTAWRILATLEHHGLVERRDGGGYAVGVSAARIGAAFAADGLVRRAHPVIAHLATLSGETATIAVTRGTGLYYVDQVAATRAESDNWLGRSVPLHCTSTGKAYLAWLPDDEVEELLPARLPRFTATTTTERSRLLAELHDTRARGYSTCAGELETDSNGVGAPVLDGGRPIAVVSIWGPPDRIPPSRFGALGRLAADGGEQLAGVLIAARDAP